MKNYYHQIIMKVFCIFGIMILFFIRDYQSHKYLEEFKSFPNSKEQGGFFNPLFIPFWVDLNIQDEYGYSLLHFAVERSDLSVMRRLLIRGAKPNLQTVSYKTPMHFAALYGQVMSLKLLAKAGANTNVLDKYHKTPAMYATERGALPSLKVLQSLGADMYTQDGDKKNLLDKAILHEYRDFILYLTGFLLITQQHNLDIIVFLNDWKEKYTKFFNITPLYNYGLTEYYLAKLGILDFMRIEDMGIQVYLYKRLARKDPHAIFNWNPKLRYE